jgi:hypothetical protein
LVEAIIYGLVIFVVGSVLMLERRCLGQMAFVQPLVVCLLAGWFVDNVEMGLWLGVSLQLLSNSPMRRFNWALCGVVGALTLMVAAKQGIGLTVGSPNALALVVVVLWVGAMARILERRYARRDGERIRTASPLLENDAVTAIESHVYRVIVRYFFVGGFQTVIGTGLALLAVVGLASVGQMPPAMVTIFAVFVPVLGAAVALSSLVEFRFFVWTGISATVAILLVFI